MINRRFISIAIIAFVFAAIITGVLYKTLKQAAQPEQKSTVAYFKYSMEKGTIINDKDIIFKETPISLIPETSINDLNDIVDKRLYVPVEKDDMVLSGKLIERGDIKVDVKKLWTIGIDISSISDCLGGNLKEGGEYALLFRDFNKNIYTVSKIKIANMTDASGKIISSGNEGVVRAVNISVEDQLVLMFIAKNKGQGDFYIIDVPYDYVVKSNISNEVNVVNNTHSEAALE